jgi:hypothetical protein
MTIRKDVRAGVRALGAASVIAVLAWSTPAAAQGDPQAQLRQLIDDITRYVADQTGGDATLRTSRPPELRMDSGAAIATLPDLSIVGRRGNAIELGTQTVSQREVAPGRVRYELSLPQRVRAVENSGAAPFTVTSSGGTLAVVRDVATGLLREADFTISELNVPPPNPGAANTTLGQLQLGWTISARPDGLSDGGARIAVRGLRAVEQGSGRATSAGESSFAFGIQGFRLDDFERVRAAFVEGAAAPFERRWQRAMEVLHTMVDSGGIVGMTAELGVANGAYSDGNLAPMVTIGRASLNLVLTALNQAASAYQFRYVQDGLALRQDVVPVPQYIPSRVNVDLLFEQIPTRALHALSVAGLAARRNNSAPPPVAALGMLIEAMSQMGTTLRIAPIDVAAPAVGATLNGTVTADARSPLQASARGDLVVRGLETVQRELGAQGGRSGADSPAAVVAVLAALGQQGTGPDGQPVRTYRIELRPEGQLLLNGADMTSLLGPAGRQRRPARAPAAQPPAQQQQQPPSAGGPAPQPPGK